MHREETHQKQIRSLVNMGRELFPAYHMKIVQWMIDEYEGLMDLQTKRLNALKGYHKEELRKYVG